MAAARAELEQLLGEDISAAKTRAAESFARLAGDAAKSIVLFGAGNLGCKTLRGLQHLGNAPRAFADNNPQRWGATVEGVPILSPKEAADRYGQNSVFVVTIWGSNQQAGQGQFRRQLQDLGCSRVVPFAFLFWQHSDQFLPHHALDRPHRLLEQADRVRQAFALFEDAESRAEYVAQVRWRLHLDFDAVSHVSADPQYFPAALVPAWADECFIDCGAFTGDTLESFLRLRQPNFRRYVAFEPDPRNFTALQRAVANLSPALQPRVTMRPAAVGAAGQAATVAFNATGTASAVVGSGDVQVEAVSLDKVLHGERPTFIKMDIEGAELDALNGAAGTIREHRPCLAICAYHHQDHLWRVPLLMNELADDYDFYLRPHSQEAFELVCYGIPREKSS